MVSYQQTGINLGNFRIQSKMQKFSLCHFFPGKKSYISKFLMHTKQTEKWIQIRNQ